MASQNPPRSAGKCDADRCDLGEPCGHRRLCLPGGATINTLRETRTGRGPTSTPAAQRPRTRITTPRCGLITATARPGAGYSYILLPNATATQTAAYAANPDVVILENTNSAHGVREQTLGITAANFWQDTTHTVGLVTMDKKSAVLVHEAATQVDVAVSDPTQAPIPVLSP